MWLKSQYLCIFLDLSAQRYRSGVLICNVSLLFSFLEYVENEQAIGNVHPQQVGCSWFCADPQTDLVTNS